MAIVPSEADLDKVRRLVNQVRSLQQAEILDQFPLEDPIQLEPLLRNLPPDWDGGQWTLVGLEKFIPPALFPISEEPDLEAKLELLIEIVHLLSDLVGKRG
jgi:hypothetical protein